MKTLKLYLESVIENDDVYFESLLDNEDIFFNPETEKKLVEEWIKNNYKIDGNLTISDDFVVSCTRNVTVKNKSITSLTNGIFRWGEVDGFFDCGNCNNLTSLKGAPEEVGDHFYCGYCEKLTSLEGSPKIVGSGFYCESCNNLTSLKGAPEKVEGVFNCNYCDKLTSLKGASKNVGGNFECRKCNNLKITDSDRKKYKIIY